jgi:hypothetical protein
MKNLPGYKRIYGILLALLFVTGCDTTVETQIGVSDLKSLKETKTLADLYFEVASCNDFEDSRKESDAVIEAQRTVPYIFEGARYLECFNKEMDSYAHFVLPLLITPSNSSMGTDYLYISTYGGKGVGIGIPPIVKEKIKKVERSSMLVDDIKLNIKIKVINDTDKDYTFQALSTYIDGEPVLFGSASLPRHQSFTLKLSDVSTDNALKNGLSPVLFDAKTR